MKKLLSLAILISIFGSSAVYAVNDKTVLNASTEENVQKNIYKEIKKHKSPKVKPQKNKYEYINMQWWGQFNDEYLNDYIIRAVENNKDLKMATLTIDEYYQNVVMQRSHEMPNISAGFLPAYAKDPLTLKSHGNFGIPIIASYEVDLFGKNHNKTTAIRKLYEASILDEQAAYISIASAVGTVYISIIKLDALIDMQEEIVALRKEISEIMTISNNEGIVSTSDLVKANKAYIAGTSDLVELKKERTKLLNQLAVLIGDSPNNIEEYKRADYKTFAFSGNIPEEVSSEIIMNRPDYKKAEKILEKAGIDVRVARKEMLPHINLGGLLFFNSKYFESLFTTSNMLWGVGGGVLQPLFQGFSLTANLKSKKIIDEKMLRNYEKVNLTSMQEVNDSLVSVNMDKEKLNKQKNIQALELKDFELTEEKYKQGVIAKLDRDQQQENLLNVQRMVYNTEFDCMIDYINYYKAVAAKV
jgi:NodT family efflux transporter outer membrane factor (OMF) lipoprotein